MKKRQNHRYGGKYKVSQMLLRIIHKKGKVIPANRPRRPIGL
jgi:hypothetical protein